MLLKTFQRLGYFPVFDALSVRLVQHLATTMGLLLPCETLQRYERRGFRKWHLPLIRARFSPYKTEHLNRFGHYELRFDQVPQPITEALRFSPALVARELARG